MHSWLDYGEYGSLTGDQVETYDLPLVITGLAVLASAVLPRLLSDKPLSPPMALLGPGFAA